VVVYRATKVEKNKIRFKAGEIFSPAGMIESSPSIDASALKRF